MTTPKILGTSVQKPENVKYNLNLNLLKSKNLPTIVQQQMPPGEQNFCDKYSTIIIFLSGILFSYVFNL